MGFNGTVYVACFTSFWNRWLAFPASFIFNLEASCDVECSNLAAILMSLPFRVKSGQGCAEGKHENNPTRPFVMTLYICVNVQFQSLSVHNKTQLLLKG